MRKERTTIFPSVEEMDQMPIVIKDSKRELFPDMKERLEAQGYRVEDFSRGGVERDRYTPKEESDTPR